MTPSCNAYPGVQGSSTQFREIYLSSVKGFEEVCTLLMDSPKRSMVSEL